MTEHPQGLDLIRQYYEVAPQIVAAIPEGHADWDWIGEQVDEAVAHLGQSNPQGAFETYCAMVHRLMENWLANATSSTQQREAKSCTQ